MILAWSIMRTCTIVCCFLVIFSTSLKAEVQIGKRTTTEWIDTLDAASATARLQAAEALGKLGGTGEAKTAAKGLIAALAAEKEPQVRHALLRGIGRMGSEATAAVPALITTLKDTTGQFEAVQALGKIGSPDAIPALAELLKEEQLCEHAARALGSIGPAALDALEAGLSLGTDAPRARSSAALGIALIAKGQPSSSSGSEQIQARLLSLLRTTLSDKNQTVRYWGAYGLGRLEGQGAAVAPDLIGALGDSDAMVSNQAANALIRISGQAVDALTAAIGDGNSTVRRGVVRALGRISGEIASDVIDALAKSLSDADSLVRYEGALSLTRIGSKATGAVAALVAALEDKESGVRNQSAEALTQLGKEAASQVASKLKKKERRRIVLRLLSKLGDDAEPAAAAVIEVLDDTDEGIRYEAVRILERIAPAESKERLGKLLSDPSERIREAAQNAIAAIEKRTASEKS